VKQHATSSNRIVTVVVTGLHDFLVPDFQQRERVAESSVGNQRVVVRESLARPNRQELGEHDNHGDIIVVIPTNSSPIEVLQRTNNRTSITSSPAFFTISGRSLDCLRLVRVNGEVETGGISIANKGGEEPIEVIKRHSHGENLAEGVGETTNHPLGAILADVLTHDEPGEETERVPPTAGKLGTVGGVGPDLRMAGSGDTIGKSILDEGDLRWVGGGRAGKMLGNTAFVATKGEGSDRHDKIKGNGRGKRRVC